jgi:hypothetical protein
MAADKDIWLCSDCKTYYNWGEQCSKGHGSYNEKNDQRAWQCSKDGSIMGWSAWYCSKCNGKYISPS